MMIYFGMFITGMVMGSFIFCGANRFARGEDFIWERSHCDYCNHPLRFYDLFPVLSWLSLKGHCRYCGQKLTTMYPLSELASGIFCILLYWKYGLSLQMVKMTVFGFCLFFLALTDLKTMEIPLFTIILPFILWFYRQPLDSLKRLVLLMSVYLTLTVLSRIVTYWVQKESFGQGDIELLAVCSLYFGFTETLYLVLIASLLALIFLLISRRKRIPFGPFIALVSLILILCD